MVAPDLQTIGLLEHLESLATSMFKSINIDVILDTKQCQEERLTHGQKLALYRIAQEQCTNIVKYAKATSVNIHLSTAGSNIKMVIADNGMGRDPNKKITGIGLGNINNRLSVLGGKCRVITSPGGGFTLAVEIPL